MNRFVILLLLPLSVFTACTDNAGGDDDGPLLPSFDRRAMLTSWADEVILPAHRDFGSSVTALSQAGDAFRAAPDQATLATLQSSFKAAYLSFQRLDPFILGEGEILRFREQANTYPTDIALIADNVATDGVNFDLPSNTAAQGFPALEYLLYGTTETLLNEPAYQDYFMALVTRLQDLNAQVLDHWESGYREVYIQNDGNSATASIDRTVNDYIFYYERFLRAGKVGIPAGIFSDDPLPDRVEARYAGYSKALFQEALLATQQFFTEQGLKQYLDALEVRRDGAFLSEQIADQFAEISRASAQQLDSYEEMVSTDNESMLRLYDELQKLVVLLKVDMLQALSINVDYVDADGD